MVVGVTTAHEVFNPGITIGLGINQMGFEVPWCRDPFACFDLSPSMASPQRDGSNKVATIQRKKFPKHCLPIICLTNTGANLYSFVPRPAGAEQCSLRPGAGA